MEEEERTSSSGKKKKTPGDGKEASGFTADSLRKMLAEGARKSDGTWQNSRPNPHYVDGYPKQKKGFDDIARYVAWNESDNKHGKKKETDLSGLIRYMERRSK